MRAGLERDPDGANGEDGSVKRTQRPSSLWWIAVLVLTSVTMASRPGPPRVRPGIDVLLTDSIGLVRDRRVGILTNQAGVDARGTDDITRLRQAGVNLTAIFSPEHGFRGRLDRENIASTVDSATGLPIFSLYGATRAPTAAMLAHVDVLLVDLQDVGVRTYSYTSTTLLVLGAAAKAGVQVVVLDRPDPIGGVQIQGPMLDTAFRSFAGPLAVPLRHGMTLGELVGLGAARRGWSRWLTVVPAAGWRRGMWFDQTGLPWVRPSPNMPDLESATHYPGLVLFEGTNLSVGRGTPIAFQVVAAPWLDAPALVTAMRRSGPVGVAFSDTTITPRAPTDRKYDGRRMPAVRLRVTNRAVYDPVATAVRMLSALRAQAPDSFHIDPGRFDRLAGTDSLRKDLEAGVPARRIVAGWQRALRQFRAVRRPFLLYR